MKGKVLKADVKQEVEIREGKIQEKRGGGKKTKRIANVLNERKG